MSRQGDATGVSHASRAALAALVGTLWLGLLACSQTAAAGASPSGARLGATELEPSSGRRSANAHQAPALELLDRHESFAFKRGAAEIVDFHAPSRRVFVVDSGEARVRVLGLGPRGFRGGERVLEPMRDIQASGDDDVRGFTAREVTSLAVGGDLLAVAVPAARNDRRGRVALYAADELRYLGSVLVGFVPDMLTFTPDVRRILVANEGEQVRGPDQRISADPEGSVSIIDLRGGSERPLVSHARFTAFDARVEEYRASGVRIARLGDRFFESGEGRVRLSRDLEPENIAVAADGRRAWVSLQENDAVALLDIEAAAFIDIYPLGVKDFSRGQPALRRVPLLAAPSEGVRGEPSAGLERAATGLWSEPRPGEGSEQALYVLRGSRIEHHALESEHARCTAVTALDPRLAGDALRGLARDARGGAIWVGNATRPVIYRLDAGGKLLDTFTLTGAEGGRVTALAFDVRTRRVFAFVETPGAARAQLLVVDADPQSDNFGERVSQHVYVLDAPGEQGAHAVAASVIDREQLLVQERSANGQDDVVYRVDLVGAADLRALEHGARSLDDAALRELLSTHAVSPVHKRVALSVTNPGAATAAGLAVLSDGRLALLGGPSLRLLGGPALGEIEGADGTMLGVVSFDVRAGLDASDQDGAVRLSRWPVLGEYMPDGIAALRVGGQDYFLTANEGDTRGYDAERLRDVELDPTRFPDAAAMQASAGLGRLKVSVLDGDLDGDGDLDEVHAFGARSLSLWDHWGRLVFDTGSLFEEVTAAALADAFNSNNDANGSFDTRSDDRGPEPEGLTLAEIDGHTYAFVGLERVGGIVVLDVTEPSNVRFVEYDNLRDFSANAERSAARDLGPEGLKFVPAAASPTGRGLLLVANEVSGTTTAYDVNL